MAINNQSKDPTNINSAINPDTEVPSEKRRITDLLPVVNRTETLKKFFDSSIDHLFQPSDFTKISGYIGRKPGYWDITKDFYLKELTQERTDYQLEPAAISKDDTGEVTNIMFYADIINHIRFQGGITNDHNRLFEQKYYSWAPPVDLDKITAYWNYFWLPTGPNIIEISYATDVNNALIGLQYPDPSDPVFGGNGVAPATSGLRIKLTNDATSSRNNVDYVIEGVGRSILLVEETASSATAWDSPPGPAWDALGWDVGGTDVDTPDYIVMERGAADGNQWSAKNRWFHADVIAQSGTTVNSDISSFQASRPIIEFTRNLKLYNFSATTIGTVDLVYEGIDAFDHLNGYQVWTAGDFSDTTSTIPNDWSHGQFGFVKVPSYTDSNGDIRTEVDGFSLLRDGMKILVTSDTNPAANNKIYTIGGIQNTGVVNLIDSGLTPVEGDHVGITYGSSFSNGVFVLTDSGWEDGQRKSSINQAPLFQLYDIDETPLDDPGVYTNSTFTGNKIFGFQENISGVTDTVLGFPLSYDNNGDIVYENFIVTDRSEYNSPSEEIIGFYFYKISGSTVADDIYSNSWNQISTRTQQYILQEEYLEDGQDPYITLITEPGIQEATGLPTLIVTVDGQRLDDTEYYVDTNFTAPVELPGAILVLNGTPGNFVQIKIFNENYNSDDYTHWEIPLNLQGNPNNLEVETITSGQYFDQFSSIINNQDNFVGAAYSTNNWRDTPQNRALGREIMQHRAPMLKLMILTSTENLDFMLSSRYVEREYSRTRNKLIQKFTQFNLNTAYASKTSSEWLSDALLQINIGKTNSFPFYYSGMIAEGSFIPSTPSRLGVYKVYKPEAYLDNTFITDTWTIRGHDGSQYIMFGDLNVSGPSYDPTDCSDPRDAAYLEYENQIYDSIPDSFKTEKLPDYNYQEFFSGKFRTTDYTREEIVQLSQPMFERWVSTKSINYRENDGWSPDNKFTWNYHSSLDKDGKRVPGSWRGIYNWYFDTDRPHTHPWEMLGFSEMPNWWTTEYGPAPWTGGNMLMWQDLEAGYVRNGARAGINTLYARPGLTNIIPVDASGNLLNPVSCRIIPQDPTYQQGKASWEFGDQGPIENVWLKSEFYPFAVAQVSYLSKPARFIETGWDPDRWAYKFEDTEAFQWINTETNDRPSNSELYAHGEILDDSTIYVSSGIQQWISDWVTSRGQNITTQFGNIIRGLDVQLAHKMGGYTDSRNLKLLTDNFGLIPDEDITVLPNLSSSIKESVYSGVIIEWSGTGWKVYGYDILNPSFMTIPGDLNGRKIWIKVGEPEIELPDHWVSNTAYTIGDKVRYQGIIYEASAVHTSKSIFERKNWSYIGSESPDQGTRVQECLEPTLDLDTLSVPYGTEFKSQQEVYNFLIDYERWLTNEGWLFDVIDSETNDTKNFRRAGKEFLMWSLNSWATGSFIALSPAANLVKFKATQGAIQSVENLIRGVYPLLDKTGVKINPFDTNVTRFEDTISIKPTDDEQGIYSCRLSIKEYEHVVTTNNVTIFNDLIYDVLFNVRQPRFIINSILTSQWTGRLDAPGFIVNEGAIYSNFEKTVADFDKYFAIENSPSNPALQEHARHLVGFQFRDYLQSLLIDPDVSFQFYQGMLQAKGTPSSLGELIKTEKFDEQEKLDFFEEWAFRLGSFGATDIRPSIEFQLDRSEIRNNPQLIEFACDFTTDDLFDESIQLGPDDSRWLRKPVNMDLECAESSPDLNIWPLRGQYADELYDLPSAGYVKLDEVDYYIADSIELGDLYSDHGFIALYDTWLMSTVYVLGDQIIYSGSTYECLESHTSSTKFEDDRNKWLFVAKVSTTGLKERDTIWLYDTNNIINPGQFGVFRITDTSAAISLIEFGGDNSTTITLNTDPVPALNTNPSIVNIEYNEKNIRTLREDGVFDISKINPGDFILIPESTQSNPDLEGIHRITQIIDSVTFEIEGNLTSEFDYTISGSNFEEPKVFFLQNMRVANTNESDNITSELNSLDPFGTPLTDGELVWIDDARTPAQIDDGLEAYWEVRSYASIAFSTVMRTQELKLDTHCLTNSVVYDKRTNRITTWLEAYDPRKGVLPGVADKELWYKLEYDPAKYTNGDDELHQIDLERAWGSNEVSRLWWDISTVKYLEYEMGDNTYRNRWWGKLAPGTSIDVYEWVKSDRVPTEYNTDGEVKDSDNPAWVEREEFNEKTGQMQTVFYFWVKNVTTVPNVPFRKVNAVNVTKIIEDPTFAGINWFCPITDQAVSIANTEQFLVDEDTVLQINWKDNRTVINRSQLIDTETDSGADYKLIKSTSSTCNENANIHRQWDLMREGDSSSLPNTLLWQKLKDSLVGFNDQQEAVPDPALSEVERYGTLFRPRQTWFARINDARKVFVTAANTLLLAANIVSDRSDWDNNLYGEETEPSSDGTTYSQTEATGGIATYTVPEEVTNSSQIEVRVNDALLTEGVQYEVTLPDQVIFNSGYEPNIGDFIEFTIKNYDYDVADVAARDALIGTIVGGQRVLVQPTVQTNGRWSLWEYAPAAPPALSWELLAIQSYKTTEAWDLVDWYATGYSPDTEVDYTYVDSSAFNIAQGTETYTNDDIVKITDVGGGRWNLYVYDSATDAFTKVGEQDGTIQIDDIFYTYEDGAYDLSVFEGVPEETLDTLLQYPYTEFVVIIDALRNDILVNLEVNNLFFSMIRYMHSEQNMIDWVFKTSYIYLVGSEEELAQTPILRTDATDDFINYINEAKPYHVKIRDFQQNKKVPDDIYNVLATDFDRPPYYDTDQSQYRPLELENLDDLEVIEGTRPWTEWYTDYQEGGGPEETGTNVRKLNTYLYFDRVKCWTDQPIPGENTDTITMVSNAPTGKYTIFTVSEAKAVVTEVRITVKDDLSQEYEGDGATKTFAAPTIILQPETLEVYIHSTLQTLDTDYVIAQNGLSVEFLTPPDVGDQVVIVIDESFDAPGATITIGDELVSNAGLVTSAEVDTSTVLSDGGTLVVNPNKSYDYDTNIIVVFIPNGSIKGIVNIEIDYELDINVAELSVNISDAADRIALLYNPSDDREKKILERLPYQDRVKGTTLTTSDLVSDESFRSKYKVIPISRCDYKGTNYEGYDFSLSGFDTKNYSEDEFDNENSEDGLDVNINGGQAIFETYLIDVATGGTSGTYTVPATFSSPTQITVSLDGSAPLTQSIDYTPVAPDQLIFPSVPNGQIIQVVISPLGTTFIEAPLSDSDIVIEGHKFLQPYYDDDHPEELINVSSYSSLFMDVFYESIAGCPIIMSDRFISNGTTAEYELLQVPQNRDAVWVYINGKFVKRGNEFTLDQTANSVILTPVPPSGTPIKITTFSPGGHRIRQELYETADGATNKFDLLETTIKQNVTAFKDGVEASFSLQWDSVNLVQYVQFNSMPAAGSEIQIVLFEPRIFERYYDDAGLATFTLTTTPVTKEQIQVLVNNVPASFSLLGQDITITTTPAANDEILVTVYEESKVSKVRTSSFTAHITGTEQFVLPSAIESARPIESVVFVRKNGIRLLPNTILYENAAAGQTEFDFTEIVDTGTSTIAVWVDDVLQTLPTNYTLNYASGTFVNKIIFTSPFTGGEKISIRVDKNISQFDVINNQTISVTDVVPGDTIQISYFTFDDTYVIKTEKYKQRLEGIYPLAQKPFGPDYIWVYVNGRRILLNRDYLLKTENPGLETEQTNVIMNKFLGQISGYGTNPDAELSSGEISLVESSPHRGWDSYAWDEQIDNTLPPPPLGPISKITQTYLWDGGVHDPELEWFDSTGYDAEYSASSLTDDILITTVAGPPVTQHFAYTMFKDKFEDLSFSRISDPHKLFLRQDLLWNDTVGDKDKEILLDVNPKVHILDIPDDLLYVPTDSEPGVLHINGERIEYWEVEKLTDGSTGLPYYRIPYKEVTYTNPDRVEKLPKFLRRTKATAIGAPEYINGVQNTELVIPEGTLVVPAGLKHFFGIPYNRAAGTTTSLQVDYTISTVVGDGTTTTYSAPITPTRTTITTPWLITGANGWDTENPDREFISGYTLTDDDIIFDTPIQDGYQVEIIATLADSFNLINVDNPQADFLRATYGTYEK